MKIGLFKQGSKYLRKENTFSYVSRYSYGEETNVLLHPSRVKKSSYIQALYNEKILTNQEIDLIHKEDASHFFENPKDWYGIRYW